MTRDERIIAARQAGDTLPAIAASFGLSIGRVHQIVGSLDPAERTARRRACQLRTFAIVWNDELDDALRALRGMGHGDRLIGELMGFSWKTINRRVHALGLPPGRSANRVETKGII